MHKQSRVIDWLLRAHLLHEPPGATPWRPEPQEIVEPIPECCVHCSCIMRNHPCCGCGVWLKDIEPIKVAGKEMRLNPIAMEIGRRYGYRLSGETLWSYAVRHRDESVQIVREQSLQLCTAVETVVEDCRLMDGWLSLGVECGIDHEPWCYYHEMQDAMELDPHYVPRLHGSIGED